MSDYINREMAADCIVLECDGVTLEQARQAIKDCPSADVESVRHGHWEIEEVPCIYGKKFILTCSECGESVSVTELALAEEHYCRSCGARMDGKEHGHE